MTFIFTEHTVRALICVDAAVVVQLHPSDSVEGINDGDGGRQTTGVFLHVSCQTSSLDQVP